jgi:hypothetical protein
MNRNVEVFSGAADPAEARVYAVAALAEKRHEFPVSKLNGYLIGPACEFAHTLAARIHFADRVNSDTVLSEALVPDPCFWTPELPFLYRAELDLQFRDGRCEKFEQTIGIRRFGARGPALYFEGKRFVVRGIGGHFALDGQLESKMAYLRQTWTAAAVAWPTADLCELASRRGTMLIADLRVLGSTATPAAAADMAHTIARWPAVVMAIVDPDSLPMIESQGPVRNLLIGQFLSPGEDVAPGNAVQIIFAEVGELADFARTIKQCDRPVIAVRRVAQPAKIEHARAACDVLQSELAPYGDFAGYVV